MLVWLCFNAPAIKVELWWSWDKTWRLYHLHHTIKAMICCLQMAPIRSTRLYTFDLTAHWNCKFFSLSEFFLPFHGTSRVQCLIFIPALVFLNNSLLSLFYLSCGLEIMDALYLFFFFVERCSGWEHVLLNMLNLKYSLCLPFIIHSDSKFNI